MKNLTEEEYADQITEAWKAGFAEGQAACKTQCWEPCGELGKSEAHVAVAPSQEPVAEHDLKDIRCGYCGYMTYQREHMGCIRSAAPPDAAAQIASLTTLCDNWRKDAIAMDRQIAQLQATLHQAREALREAPGTYWSSKAREEALAAIDAVLGEKK